MNYRDKYLKYKKKYLDFKRYNDIKLKGGALIDLKILDTPNIINDEFTILDYHGSLIDSKTFTIPENIILILSDCCGASNYTSLDIWNDPLLNATYAPNTFSKQYLINNIKTNKSKLFMYNQQYIVLQPGSEICDFSLINKKYDFAVGTILKKFDEPTFYHISKIFTNEVEVNKRIQFMKTGLSNYINKGISDTYSYINMDPLYHCHELRYFLDLFIANTFEGELYEKVFEEKVVKGKNTALDGMFLFLDNISYETLTKTTLTDKSKYNKDIKIDIDSGTNLRNIDLLIYLFFEGFIKENENVNNSFNLSDRLGKISRNQEQKTFVFLYACQGSNGGQCSINKCYRRFHGTINPSSDMNTILINAIKKKMNIPGFKLSNDTGPIIRFGSKESINIALLADRLDINIAYVPDIIIFINMFYDMLTNNGTTIIKKPVVSRNFQEEFAKIWDDNKISYNTKLDKNDKLVKEQARFREVLSRPNKHRNNKCKQLGQLITPKCDVITIELIKKFYNKDTYIINILNDINQHSYLTSFKYKFKEFLKLIIPKKSQYITLENFYVELCKPNNILYDKLVTFFKETNSLSFPIEINNEIHMKNIFKSLFFTSEDYRNKVCEYITTFDLYNGPGFELSLATLSDKSLKLNLEKLIVILKQVDILLKYSNTSMHTIESYYPIKSTILTDEIKINYLLWLIKSYNCNKLIQESGIIIN